ncbi:alpha-L-rhamnosidase [Actinoplanes lutulentus]|uniref:alpha-L-rhamnosidase n=1 Tax=Actinoplanes lutulentus TaxID=1287878 RepID=A0A327Z2K1_9ACTN|nr:family 78 glycoside hydrolase catalytic domain [Actinoplanes lutulentus]MBB2946524.1 alpha-L-rhamnosidase [Actinoplanes lutulentus]RAK26442.1 alpha-L-rhamnosidase [Actinoplanes lutulentus]
MRAVRLRTEYLAEPLGLDIARPRFYWNAEAGTVQTAYRIVARRGDETVWDSGKVASARMTHVGWDGTALTSRDRIDWTVTLWDENDVAGEGASSWFEMGLLEKGDWTGRWITGDYRPKKHARYPVDCFRQEFDTRRVVIRARLYITACGVYEAFLNGRRVGDAALAPGSTDYRHRLHYQVYDVLDLLSGRNLLDVRVGDGWYRGSVNAFGSTNVFGRRTKLLCQLELTYADGSAETIGSDDSWAWSNDGPIRFADLQDGEVYDAGRVPSYAGRARLTTERLVPRAANNVVPKEHEILRPSLLTTPSGQRVLDFGQNIAGFVAFTVRGSAGQRVVMRLGEILDASGEFTQRNFQERKPVKEPGKLTSVLLISGQAGRIRGELQPTPKQEIDFTCSGGLDHYRTSFAVFGFRYALVETDLPIDPAAFSAVAVYSDMGSTGDFTCSNADVNRFVENTRWSMKGNFLDVPTDCPTRERIGWTGDAQVFFDTAAHLMDVSAFFRKWLHDLRDGQLTSGKPSAVAPYSGLSMLYDSTGGSVGWGDAVVLVPYRFWKRYGDVSVLREFYDMMRAYALFMIKNTSPGYAYQKGVQLGEWLEPEEFRDPMGARGRVPQTEVATAYLHYTMTLMAEVAGALDHGTDETLFREYAQGAKAAYLRLFAGTFDTDRQAKLVRPLALGLVDGDLKRTVQQRLVQAVENRGYRVGTGFLSTPFLLPALTDAGRADVAYRVLQNEQAPSWLAEVKAGATTVWEDWEGTVSHNHYAPGAVCQWLFDTVAGIRVDGENRFVIAPVPGGGLTYAAASYTSLYGTVTSRWEDGVLDVTVPPNTTAEIVLPDGKRHTAGAGTHAYDIEGFTS